MKKTLWFALILMLLCVFALSACDNADTPPNNDNGRQTTDENGDNNSPENPTVCQHTFGEWDTVKQATCKEEGKRTRTCNKCSETEEESIQKSETHTTVIDEAVPATCKDTGLTEGSHCSVCNEVLVAQTVAPKTEDHTPVIDVAVPATCKDTGLTEGSHCSVCNEVLVAQTIVPKTEDHTTVTDKAVSATCKNTGLTEGSHCSVCGKVFNRQIEVPITSNHSFISNQCSLCNLKVIEHGNADGSISGGNNKVKYYVTGDIENYKDFEIVIYGNGEMPNFSQTSLPLWYDYLPHTVKIRIENGVTSIGKYAFYYPSSTTSCKFIMSDTVKTVRSNSISLKIKNLTLGNGVETVESNGIGNIDSIYIPRSVKNLYLDALGNETYFYEGSLEEFYQIQMYVYNRAIKVKDYIAMLDDNFISNIHIYVQAKNISDRSHYWR